MSIGVKCARCRVTAFRTGAGALFCAKCGRGLDESGAGEGEIVLTPRDLDYSMNLYSHLVYDMRFDSERERESLARAKREALRPELLCAGCQRAVSYERYSEGWWCGGCGGVVPSSYWEDKPLPELPVVSKDMVCAYCEVALQKDVTFDQWVCPKCGGHLARECRGRGAVVVTPRFEAVVAEEAAEFEPVERECGGCRSEFWAMAAGERECVYCRQLKDVRIERMAAKASERAAGRLEQARAARRPRSKLSRLDNIRGVMLCVVLLGVLWYQVLMKVMGG